MNAQLQQSLESLRDASYERGHMTGQMDALEECIELAREMNAGLGFVRALHDKIMAMLEAEQ